MKERNNFFISTIVFKVGLSINMLQLVIWVKKIMC